MNSLLTLVVSILTATSLLANTGDKHTLFTMILQDYVTDGVINYRDLRSDPRLPKYLESLSSMAPDSIGDDNDRLAFWLNTYNAFTLKIICDNYPVESINELHFINRYIGYALKKTVWDKKFIEIKGNEISLNHIEHEIVRKEFSEPRAHFALVCASKSCPPLRSEAFEGYKLDEQLQDQGRAFFADPARNRLDEDKKVAHLSAIFKWFRSDFGKSDEDILEFVARFLPEEVATDIRTSVEMWDIEYLDYDWSLNGF